MRMARISDNQVRRTYMRSEFWTQKVKIADWWNSEILQMVNQSSAEKLTERAFAA